ncbi:MAG: bifunctional [glutamate--ammonia ligase]-adenylyl-L-tyrosine phosphorylase/[glutamate--ammonia-ligase] adenylyltransferase [Dokdonella sp.]
MTAATTHPMTLTRELADVMEQRLERLHRACCDAGISLHDDAGVDQRLRKVLLASDFALTILLSDLELLGDGLIELVNDPRPASARETVLDGEHDDADMKRALRRFRKRESLRLIWRDVNGLDDVEATLHGSSVLAEACLERALEHARAQVARRHGVVRDQHGVGQKLIVLGLGKLGGGELNFSSDVDLILAYRENGVSDGERPIDADAWFARLTQQFISLLADVTADGYVYRVDLRLRPFGTAGRVALSFAAMEQYYQREGRDWERYAWIKARPVAGDLRAGNALLELLRPFVFRRYFDYTAFAGLREMKALIDAEVARKDLAANLKLGPGGIREIEFIVQLVQLIRGGREPALRVRGLLPALAACEQLGQIPSQRARRLRSAYLFLRRAENRVQMFADEQTHELPEDPIIRERIARSLDLPDWPALLAASDQQRAAVTEEFDAVMAAPQRERGNADVAIWSGLWQRFIAHGVDEQALVKQGIDPPDAAVKSLQTLLASPILRAAAARSRERINRVLPLLMAAAAESRAPGACLARLVELVHAVARRSAYLALLDEQPAALRRLVDVFTRSALLADRIIAHPLLLDELFDEGGEVRLPAREELAAQIQRQIKASAGSDTEAAIELIQEQRLAAQFRVGLNLLGSDADAVQAARDLAGIAEIVLDVVLYLARRDLAEAHGELAGLQLVVLGYGSLGGEELGFSSDLDLVFVYDGVSTSQESDGKRPLEAQRYLTRLAQRVVHLLTTLTRSGRLYDIDMRLRPDGGKSLLVTQLHSYAAYQRERAWTWEHQALVRARAVAGDSSLAGRFRVLRADVLSRDQNPSELRDGIVDMRARWRAERDRSSDGDFDLKQGIGGIVDIEFLLQALVIEHGRVCPALLAPTNSADLIVAATDAGILSVAQGTALENAHALLLARALGCTLDGRSRVIVRDAELDEVIADVGKTTAALGLAFR